MMRRLVAGMLCLAFGCATQSYVQKSGSTPGRYAVMISGKGLMGFAYDSLRMAGFSDSEIITIDSDDYKHYHADFEFTRKNVKQVLRALGRTATPSDLVVVYLGPDFREADIVSVNELEELVERITPFQGLLVELITERKGRPLRFYDGTNLPKWRSCPEVILNLNKANKSRARLPL